MAGTDFSIPTLAHEERLWQAGFAHVAGIDEAGRGTLAGPVVAGAVIVPTGAEYAGLWTAARDSKTLKPGLREEMYGQIQEQAAAWGIGSASATEIDEMGIAPATQLAMQRAIEQLSPPADYLLIDWVKLPQVKLPQESHKKADRDIVSVAAASILAKVYRDQHMTELDARYPNYEFGRHKGYGTAVHLAALALHGPCPVHRYSFAPVKNAVKPLHELEEKHRQGYLFHPVEPEEFEVWQSESLSV